MRNACAVRPVAPRLPQPKDYGEGPPADKTGLGGLPLQPSFRARWFLRAAVRRTGDTTGRRS
jgi:hypothetical protein